MTFGPTPSLNAVLEVLCVALGSSQQQVQLCRLVSSALGALFPRALLRSGFGGANLRAHRLCCSYAVKVVIDRPC